MALEPKVLHVRRADRRHERRRGAGDPGPDPRPEARPQTRRSCWSSTRWTWCASWPTASSCCTTASSSPTASPAEVIASPVVQQAYLGMAPARRLPHEPAEPAGLPRSCCLHPSGADVDAGSLGAGPPQARLLPLGAAAQAPWGPHERQAAQLQGVHTHIGAYHILHGVDLAVPAGQVTMLLGRNGAGKTTTLRTIMGLWQASHGQVVFGGRRIGGPRRRPGPTAPSAAAAHAMATPEIAQLGIAYVPENMGIFADLTVQENMVLAARGARTRRRHGHGSGCEWIFGLFPALKKFWLYPAGKLSGGQKQMLAVARAIVEPRAAAADRRAEQGAGAGDRQQPDRGAARAQGARARRCCWSSRTSRSPRRLGDHVAVMDNGRVVHRGRDGRAGRGRGAAAAPARPVAGGAPVNERRRQRSAVSRAAGDASPFGVIRPFTGTTTR